MKFRDKCPQRSTSVPVENDYKNIVASLLQISTIDAVTVMIWIIQERSILR